MIERDYQKAARDPTRVTRLENVTARSDIIPNSSKAKSESTLFHARVYPTKCYDAHNIWW